MVVFHQTILARGLVIMTFKPMGKPKMFDEIIRDAASDESLVDVSTREGQDKLRQDLEEIYGDDVDATTLDRIAYWPLEQ